MEFSHYVRYRRIGDENCYNLVSPNIQILVECESLKTKPIEDISEIILKYASNSLQPIFESKTDAVQNEVVTSYFTPLYVGPLNKDFCNKYQLPYKDIIDVNIESDEMEIRFNPNLLYLIPDRLKPFLIGMVEVNKNSLYNIENSELMGIVLCDKARYVPSFAYGKNSILSKNICIESDAEEILYFENDIPDIEIKENEVSNSAYTHFIYGLN